jgi:hypothetical protein
MIPDESHVASFWYGSFQRTRLICKMNEFILKKLNSNILHNLSNRTEGSVEPKSRQCVSVDTVSTGTCCAHHVSVQSHVDASIVDETFWSNAAKKFKFYASKMAPGGIFKFSGR